jgi:hypothetical protein
MTVKTQKFYYNLLLQGYMFRYLRVIIRPSNELIQDYLIPRAVLDQFIRRSDDDSKESKHVALKE